MLYVIVGLIGFFFGLATSIFFNTQSYDKGFDDGWAEAKRDDRFKGWEEE